MIFFLSGRGVGLIAGLVAGFLIGFVIGGCYRSLRNRITAI
jgi:hypothetical protein